MSVKRTLFYLFSTLVGALCSLEAESVVIKEIDLEPSRYYFFGHDTGWVGKSRAGHGVRPALKFRTTSAIQEDRYSYKFKGVILDGENALVTKEIEDSLLIGESILPLTNKAYVPFDEREALDVFNYDSLEVYQHPYVKLNNKGKSLFLVSAFQVEELENYVSIPRSFALYEWNFPFVIGQSGLE